MLDLLGDFLRLIALAGIALKIGAIVLAWWALGIFALWAQFTMDGTPSSRMRAARDAQSSPSSWSRGDVIFTALFGFICGPVYLAITLGIFLAWIIRPGTRLGAWFEKPL